jgi:hypothetical protein
MSVTGRVVSFRVTRNNGITFSIQEDGKTDKKVFEVYDNQDLIDEYEDRGLTVPTNFVPRTQLEEWKNVLKVANARVTVTFTTGIKTDIEFVSQIVTATLLPAASLV